MGLLKEYRVRLKRETCELLKAEAERRGIPITQLVNAAIFWFLHGHRPVEDSRPIGDLSKVLSEVEELKQKVERLAYPISDFSRALSEIGELKQEVEKIKRFLLKRFGMEVYGLT